MSILCFSTNLTSEELAAWVQAVGSIVAIIAAALIAILSARAQHSNALALHETEQRHARLQVSKTLSTLATNCAQAVSYISAHLPDRWAVNSIATGDTYLDLEEIRRLDTALTNIPLHSLPSSLVTPVLILGATIRQFVAKVDMALRLHREMDAAAFDDFFATLRQMKESLAATCADIEAEVRIVDGTATED